MATTTPNPHQFQLKTLYRLHFLTTPISTVITMRIALLLEDQRLGAQADVDQAIAKVRPPWAARKPEKSGLDGLCGGGNWRMVLQRDLMEEMGLANWQL